jgi:hypothetical protein
MIYDMKIVENEGKHKYETSTVEPQQHKHKTEQVMTIKCTMEHFSVCVGSTSDFPIFVPEV